MVALTIVEEIRIATPCEANWDEMAGDERVRSCPACSRAVYNIAAMTSAEAAALIAGREGRLCARVFRRADGTVVTSDCSAVEDPTPPATRPRARIRRTHALALVLVALSLAWIGRGPGEPLPSGAEVTWDDWVNWAAVSLGLRPTPPSTPILSPTVTMGDVF